MSALRGQIGLEQKGEIGKSGRKRRDGGCDRTKGGKLKKSKTSEGG